MLVDFRLPALAKDKVTPESFAPTSLFEEVIHQRKVLASMMADQSSRMKFVVLADSDKPEIEACFIFHPVHAHTAIADDLCENPKEKTVFFDDSKAVHVVASGSIHSKDRIEIEHDWCNNDEERALLIARVSDAVQKFLRGIIKQS